MFEYSYFSSLESFFDRILHHKGKLYAYGTGNGCEKLIGLLKEKSIALDGIFASDDFAREQIFCGYKVRPLSEMEENSTVLIAFGSDLPQIMERVENLEKNHCVISPDLALFDNTCFSKEYFLENFSRAEKAYNLFSDELSRKTFENLTAYKITGNLQFLREIFVSREEYLPLLKLGENEIYCDLGAYNGDTIKEFVQLANGNYRYIYAVEPEKRNFQKCVKNCKNLDNISFVNHAVWSHNTLADFQGKGGRQGSVSRENTGHCVPCISVDNLLEGKECTYLKFDVEGADFPAIRGADKTIKKFSPKIFTALYHHPYDYFEIPLYINEIYGGYDFYMRQSPYYPAWETNLICKNKEL